MRLWKEDYFKIFSMNYYSIFIELLSNNLSFDIFIKMLTKIPT